MKGPMGRMHLEGEVVPGKEPFMLIGSALWIIAVGAGPTPTQALLTACGRSDCTAAEVLSLIEDGAVVRSFDENLNTPLHLAARSVEDPDVVRVLVEHGAALEARDEDWWTPQRLAAGMGSHPLVLQALLEFGEDSLLQEEGGLPSLLRMAAFNNEDPACISWLIDQGVAVEGGPYPWEAAASQSSTSTATGKEYQPHESALMWAAEAGNDRVVELLLARGADPNWVAGPCGDTQRKWGDETTIWTPLTLAAMSAEDAVTLDLLLNAGAVVDQPNSQGLTPLQLAAAACNEQGVTRLLSAGADANARDSWGITPLMHAAACGDAAVVGVLLDAGAECPLHDRDGDTAMFVACRWGDASSIDRLIAAGADVEARFRESMSPVTIAAGRDTAAPLASLLRAGARAQPVPNGDHPLCEVATADAATLLIESGCPVNAAEPGGCVPLVAAVERNDPEIVRLLLDGGADVNEVDGFCSTPLQNAIDGGWPENGDEQREEARISVIRALLEAGADVRRYMSSEPPLMAALSYGAPPRVIELLVNAGARPRARSIKGSELSRRHPHLYDREDEYEDYAKPHTLDLLRHLDLADDVREAYERGIGESSESQQTDLDRELVKLCVARELDEDAIGHALEMGADPNARYSNGQTLLTRFLDNGRRQAATRLLRVAGARPDLTDDQGDTPCTLAALAFDDAPRDATVAFFKQLNLPSSPWNSVVDACEEAYFVPSGTMCDALAEAVGLPEWRVDPVEWSPPTLIRLIEEDGLECARALIARGAMAPLSDYERAWVLNAAVRRLDEWGYDQQFRGLLDAILNAGADPNLWVCDEAMTDPSTSCLHGIGAWWSARLPLPMAIEWAMGNSGSESTLPVVELLLTAGADPDRRDAGDGAAIELAAMFGDDPDLLDLLLRHSDRPVADLAVAALRKNDIPVIQKLMALSGMSVNALVDGNRSPLHVAAGAGNLAAVEYLVGHGADVNASDADGRTALMLASATADVRTTAALLAHGVDVHAVDVTGRDALWHALESGDPFSDGHSRRRCSTVVEHLLEAGAVLHPHHAWAINWDDSIDADPRALDWVWSLSESMHRGNTVASKKPTQTTSPPPPASG